MPSIPGLGGRGKLDLSDQERDRNSELRWKSISKILGRGWREGGGGGLG